MKTDTNKDKGRAGLAIAIGYYGSSGYTVSVPLNDTQDYDLIVDKDGVLSKVQVKCTGSLDENGRYNVSVKSCGGTNGSIYARVIDMDIDFLFVVCTNGWLFEIPKAEITQRSIIAVYGIENEVNNTYKYLVKYHVGTPEVPILEAKVPVTKAKIPVTKCSTPKKLKEPNRCIDCGKAISRRAVRCDACNRLYVKSRSWSEEWRDGRPSKAELTKMITDDVPFTIIGRMYDVTGNTVRKWCRKYNLPFRRSDIEDFKNTLESV